MNISGDDIIRWLGSTIFSGVVVSGLLKFFYDKQIEQIKHSNQTEIEKYKSDLTKQIEMIKLQHQENHDLVKHALSHFQAGHQYSQERRLQAVEKLWSFATEIRQAMSPILNVYVSLKPSEYALVYSHVTHYPIHEVTPKIKNISAQQNELNKVRPFAGEVLWASHISHWAFLSLLYVFFISGYDKCEIPVWHEIPEIVRLPKAVLQDFPDVNIPFSIIQVLDGLEKLLLNEMDRLISGVQASDASVERSKKIILMYQQSNQQLS